MGQFLNSLLSRHLQAPERVLPRLPGNFEPVNSFRERELNEPVTPIGRVEKPMDSNPIFRERRVETRPGFNEIKVDQDSPISPLIAGFEDNPGPLREIFREQPDFQPEPGKGNYEQVFRSKFEPKIEAQPQNKSEASENNFNPAEKPIPGNQSEKNLPVDNGLERIFGEADPVQPKPFNEASPNLFQDKREDRKDDSRGRREKSSGVLGEPPGFSPPNFLAGNQGLPEIKTASQQAPVIKVSIGQIHVRAISPAPTVSSPKPLEVRKPLLSLEDYLKGRG